MCGRLMTRDEAAANGALASEDWRHACEVRTVLEMPIVDRREHFERVEKMRGMGAANRLRDDVCAEWERRRNT